DDRLLGPSAVAAEPVFQQIVIGCGTQRHDTNASGENLSIDARDARVRFERKLYVIRKRLEHAVKRLPIPDTSRQRFAVVSLSCNTLIYKGMLTAEQIQPMFPDLSDPDLESALALVHQRFSTNTFPSW